MSIGDGREQLWTVIPGCMWAKIKGRTKAHSLINLAEDVLCYLKGAGLSPEHNDDWPLRWGGSADRRCSAGRGARELVPLQGVSPDSECAVWSQSFILFCLEMHVFH